MIETIEGSVQLSAEFLSRIVEGLKKRGGSESLFDGLVYDLIEEGIVSPYVGELTSAIYNEKKVGDCYQCDKFTVVIEDDPSGLFFCSSCIEDANDYQAVSSSTSSN